MESTEQIQVITDIAHLLRHNLSKLSKRERLLAVKIAGEMLDFEDELASEAKAQNYMSVKLQQHEYANGGALQSARTVAGNGNLS